MSGPPPQKARKASFAMSEHAPSRKASLTGRQAFCLGEHAPSRSSMPLSRAGSWAETQMAMDDQYPTPSKERVRSRQGSADSAAPLYRGLSFWNPHGKHGKHANHAQVQPSPDEPQRVSVSSAHRRASSTLRAESLRLQQEAVRQHLMPLKLEPEEPALLRRYLSRGLVHPTAWWLRYWMLLVAAILTAAIPVLTMAVLYSLWMLLVTAAPYIQPHCPLTHLTRSIPLDSPYTPHTSLGRVARSLQPHLVADALHLHRRRRHRAAHLTCFTLTLTLTAP